MKFYFPWRRYRNRPAIATPLSDVVDIPRCTTTCTASTCRAMDSSYAGLRMVTDLLFLLSSPLASPSDRSDLSRTCREPWPDSSRATLWSIFPFYHSIPTVNSRDGRSSFVDLGNYSTRQLNYEQCHLKIRSFFSKIFQDKKYILYIWEIKSFSRYHASSREIKLKRERER